MTREPPVLAHDVTIANALHQLAHNRMLAMPVVDPEGRYLGMFGRSRLFELILPKVVAIDTDLPNLARLPDLSFFPDDLGLVHERLREFAADSVGTHLDTKVPVLHPDTPIVATLFLLYRTRNFLPVVDKASRRLVGLVTIWNAIAAISEGL